MGSRIQAGRTVYFSIKFDHLLVGGILGFWYPCTWFVATPVQYNLIQVIPLNTYQFVFVDGNR